MQNVIYKISILILLIVSVLISCNNSDKETEQQKQSEAINIKKTTTIEFESKDFDFGTIASGENVSHRFKFKNTGSENLYITKVNADCGCTIVEFSKKAILPGKESYIETVFNSSGYHGLQIKYIKVRSNTEPNETELIIAATVES